MDVQRYLNGELSAREMHDLEQQALDDPFLADALEGLQTQPGEALQQDLSELRARLQTRVTEKRGAIPWLITRRTMRVAAAVILFVGLGFTGYYTLLDQKQERPLSVAKEAAPPAGNIPPAANTAPAASEAAKNEAAANNSTDKAADSAHITVPMPDDNALSLAQSTDHERLAAKRTARRPASREPALQPVESRIQSDSAASIADVLAKTPPVASANGFAAQSPQPAQQRIVLRGVRRNALPDSLDLHRTFGNKDAKLSSNLVAVSGRVLDLNHHPLAGAYLLYRSQSAGTITGAVTDDKGQFSLYVPQKDSTRELTVAMEGYEETQYALNTNEQQGNTIYLRQNPPRLDEVVVSGIGAKRKEFMAQPPSDAPEKLDSFWQNTAPVMGRVSYLDYLASASKNLPVDTTVHGTESISFRVDKKGTLTEFRIERSLSPAHDAGVILLITEGPPWQMIHGRAARALVDVSF